MPTISSRDYRERPRRGSPRSPSSLNRTAAHRSSLGCLGRRGPLLLRRAAGSKQKPGCGPRAPAYVPVLRGCGSLAPPDQTAQIPPKPAVCSTSVRTLFDGGRAFARCVESGKRRYLGRACSMVGRADLELVAAAGADVVPGETSLPAGTGSAIISSWPGCLIVVCSPRQRCRGASSRQ
jgi:hypothetical protein